MPQSTPAQIRRPSTNKFCSFSLALKAAEFTVPSTLCFFCFDNIQEHRELLKKILRALRVSVVQTLLLLDSEDTA